MANTHDVLRELVQTISCKPGWKCELVTFDGNVLPTLTITIPVIDSRTYPEPGLKRIRNHFPVPEASYNRKTWRRWIFECCLKVEAHEIGEWFADGNERPFAPLHAIGEDPYTVHEFRDVVDAHADQYTLVESKAR